jgi:class 3 adenylate cyclase
MFADVRGSTGLAEQLPPGEFGQLLTRFWGSAARV